MAASAVSGHLLEEGVTMGHYNLVTLVFTSCYQLTTCLSENLHHFRLLAWRCVWISKRVHHLLLSETYMVMVP